MNRFEFIKTCGLACIGGLSAVTWLESCSTAYYSAVFSREPGKIKIQKSEFIQVHKGKQTVRKFILLQASEFDEPVCLFRSDPDSYSAVLMKCTHNGCGLKPLSNHLVCPCHGSEFSKEGVVLSPPAEQNLRTFQVTTDNENIYVAI